MQSLRKANYAAAYLGFLSLLALLFILFFSNRESSKVLYFQGKHPLIRKVGRFFTGPKALPTAYAPGAYYEFTFSGDFCEIVLEDEVRYGTLHNTIVYQVDQQTPVRITLSSKENLIRLRIKSKAQKHKVKICKATEAALGNLSLVGVRCEKLLPTQKPQLLFEFIGDSITCGNGADDSKVPFGEGSWYAYHNAYMSYGPLLCRTLGTDWQLSSVSGIGLNKSCCGLRYQMPDVYDFVGFNTLKQKWQVHKHRKPDVVFITLGQNDALQTQAQASAYEKDYLAFLKKLSTYYPKATLVCCNSPMATPVQKAKMNQSIQKVVKQLQEQKDANIHFFAYQGVYRSGHDKHPTLQQHQLIKAELLDFLKGLSLG
jgi:lysophospholipase L1-like esterase